ERVLEVVVRPTLLPARGGGRAASAAAEAGPDAVHAAAPTGPPRAIDARYAGMTSEHGPKVRIAPRSIHAMDVHKSGSAFRSCDTSTMSRAACFSSVIRSRALTRKAASPAARASSMSNTSGSAADAIE